MIGAKLIYDQRTRFLEGRFEARITAYQVPKSKKFPDGIKLVPVAVENFEEAIEFFMGEVPKVIKDEI